MSKLPNVLMTFYQSFNTGDTSHLYDILATDWVNHPNDPGQSADISGFKAGILDFRSAFSHFELKIMQSIQEDNNVAVHLQMSGTQIKPFAGIKPQNKPVIFYGFDRHVLSDDHSKILNTWHFEDFSNLIIGEN
ncbi:hypothetical protein B9J75_09080 [Leuconostoc citreum]|uniref:ester cyclase n=1 Tax=Leuconostoc citreum TaxID=33964 RepID=UPI000A1F0ADD|nr:ester cyclase [Leuconostoc citreum]OSP81056.1 hypothetical protein B9J75_09080 [Leuconostoc citreum]